MSQPSTPIPSESNHPLDDEFFIGYDPPMPRGSARFVRMAVVVIGAGALASAVGLGPSHLRLQGGAFEFGQPRTFSGTIVESPIPALRPDGETNGATPWPLLAVPGKHGAADALRGLAGRHVTLTGTRIVRGADTMIQMEPGSIVAGLMSGATEVAEPTTAPIQLRGEVVDSKCFLGVMVPGAGKTHEECAALCLRGGIPPALHVQDRSGASRLLLLTGPSGEQIAEPALQVAGEAIDLTGSITRLGGWLVVRTDPANWHVVRN